MPRATGVLANYPPHIIQFDWQIRDDNGQLYFGASFDNLAMVSDLVMFSNNCNVGVVTASPGSKLEVTGNVDADGFTINGVPIGTSSDSYWSESGGNVYRSLGNVGIGTTSPGARLDVIGGGIFRGMPDTRVGSYSTDDDTGLSGFEAYSTSAAGGFILASLVTTAAGHVATADPYDTYLTTRGSHNLLLATNQAERMRIDSNGNVGIGMTSPSYKLDVAGTIRGDNVSPSDIRLKENIETIDHALDKLLNLRGVYFTWKDKKEPQTRDMGLIAQEVQNVFPEVVSEDNEGIKSVNYGKLIGAMVEAMKDLDMTVKDLNGKVDQLTAENHELRAEIQALKE